MSIEFFFSTNMEFYNRTVNNSFSNSMDISVQRHA